MENRVEIRESGDLVEVEVSGKLTKEMYEQFVPVIDRAIRDHGQLRLLFIMREFHGWTAGALWDDVKFDVTHFRDIARLAIAGDKQWQRGMATFCRPFTTARVEYFPLAELEAARTWLHKSVSRAAGSGF